MRWGATDAEIAMSLPGDPFIPPPIDQTIHSPDIERMLSHASH